MAIAGGALLGLALRAISATKVPGAPAAAVAALLIVVAPCAAVAVPCALSASRLHALRHSARCAALSALSSVAALLVCGGVSPWGSAVVVGASVALALSVARALGVRGIGAATAAFAGAAVPFALAASIFVADPFVEWDRTGPGPSARARTVLALDPVASALASLEVEGGAGVDWQRSRWLYDGPPGVGQGLSVIGAYYPSRPSSPWTWSLVALAAAGVLVSIPASERYDRSRPITGSAT